MTSLGNHKERTAIHQDNPNLIPGTTIAKMMGLDPARLGDARRRLEDEGIRVFPGARGNFFITLQQLNAARGIFPDAANDQQELL